MAESAARQGRPKNRAYTVTTPAGVAECIPDECPCIGGSCTLGRYMRAAAGDGSPQELQPAEDVVAHRLANLHFDVGAMGAVNNMHRAAAVIRNYVERDVLVQYELTWTGWIVLWVVWIWGEIETRHVAVEAGISKGTLTGVATTLEKRGLITRKEHPSDARRMLLVLTKKGRRTVEAVIPEVNAAEARVLAALTDGEKLELGGTMRKIMLEVARLESPTSDSNN